MAVNEKAGSFYSRPSRLTPACRYFSEIYLLYSVRVEFFIYPVAFDVNRVYVVKFENDT